MDHTDASTYGEYSSSRGANYRDPTDDPFYNHYYAEGPTKLSADTDIANAVLQNFNFTF